MDCVNHTGVSATAYCQSCGKALCASCVRNAAGGQILCEPCWTSWHSFQQPFVAPPVGSPSPALAAVLGLIPGVGAMYNGQFIKGLIHVVIFAVLVSAAHISDIFGLLIAGWVFYQVFEAYHTAKARREGRPLPDPLGLNEAGAWLGVGRGVYPGQSYPPAGSVDPNQPAQAPPPYTQPGTADYQAPYQGQYQASYQAPYQTPYQGYTPPASGFVNPDVPPIPPVPPVPPVPPTGWRRREPIGAIVLIGLGVLFLLGQLDIFSGRLIHFTWPLLLIGLGVWLIVRRIEDSKGVSK
jgi:TM2 domain-containing membrane protein YozV